LLAIPGVTAVMYGADFVSVTKDATDWAHLKPAILGTIMEHFTAEAPLLADDAATSDSQDGEFFEPADAETVATIKELIETRVRPAVAGDGGDIVFRGFRDGVVYLGMKGACSGCPSSTATLRNGIENLLRHFLPQVKAVERI
jgi:Fe-S cluster biogenesis protein NfuA